MARERGRGRAAGRWPGGLARGARSLALGLALAASAAAFAASVTGSFQVRVELTTEQKEAPCTGAAEGDDVKVECRTGDVAQAGPNRVLHVFLNNHRLANVDTTMTTGTVTSWRVVRSGDHEYVEILVGW